MPVISSNSVFLTILTYLIYAEASIFTSVWRMRQAARAEVEMRDALFTFVRDSDDLSQLVPVSARK